MHTCKELPQRYHELGPPIHFKCHLSYCILEFASDLRKESSFALIIAVFPLIFSILCGTTWTEML